MRPEYRAAKNKAGFAWTDEIDIKIGCTLLS